MSNDTIELVFILGTFISGIALCLAANHPEFAGLGLILLAGLANLK